MTKNEARILVRDYMNGNMKRKEMMNKFELKECPLCDGIELEEDMEYHKWDLGEFEEKVCISCREDE